ncbi:MAG TPA: RDD family protein, partial [Polyangiales bacterium]|nr:RDD family protein [Polyangiales bacterium]
TVGKRVAGTRVLTRHGLAINFGQAALRNLLRIVDILPGGYLLGGVSALLDARGRRLGDIAADTLVVRVQRSARLKEILGEHERTSQLPSGDAWASAAHALTAPEREALLRLIARREGLPLDVRYDLCAKLARHLEARLGLARSEFLSDERFLLNLAAVVAPPLASTRPEPPR